MTSYFHIERNGWRITFAHYSDEASVYISAEFEGRREYNIKDTLPDGTEVKYDEWIDIPTARNYWIFCTKDMGYNRVK